MQEFDFCSNRIKFYQIYPKFYPNVTQFIQIFPISRVNYGITIWGTANQNILREVEIKMNNIVRTITWHKIFLT